LGRHVDETIVAVSHGGVTCDLLRTLFGDAAVEALSAGLIDQGMPGGAITELAHDGEGWRAIRVGSVEHIDPGDRTGHGPG
jgi:broad specificity phosphatase PhoE